MNHADEVYYAAEAAFEASWAAQYAAEYASAYAADSAFSAEQEEVNLKNNAII